MFTDEQLLKKMYDLNIVENKHSILRSKKHSNTYIKKTKITLNPKLYSEIIQKLTIEISSIYDKKTFDIIIGPAIAGICFALPIAFILNKFLIFSEKKENEMQFRPEYQEILENKRVIIIEDIITTGNSVIKIAKEISKYKGIPIAVFCIWNRNPEIGHLIYRSNITNLNYSLPIYSLINKKIQDWEPNECPICNIKE